MNDSSRPPFLRALVFSLALVLVPALEAKWLSGLSDAVRIPIPDSYVESTREQIAEYFEEGNAPFLHAMSADDVVEISAYYHEAIQLPDPVTAEIMKEMKAGYSQQIPSIKWVKEEVRSLGGKRVIYFEFSHTEDPDLPLTVVQLVFSQNGKMGMVQLAYDTPKRAETAPTIQKIVDNIKLGS